MPTPEIQPGATIVVTGVNGLIGSHVADQLLKKGYHVRGAVRNVEKSKWLTDYFEKQQYKGSKWELVSVPDLSVEGCYDEALKGASGFIHVASPLGGESTQAVVPLVVDIYLNVLKACSKTPSIKSVAITSSSIASCFPNSKVENVLDQSTFNEEGLAKGYKHPENEPGDLKYMYTYTAIKVASEKACWEWIRENKPHYRFNAILPNANFSKVLVPEKQGAPSTASWVKAAFNGGEEFVRLSKVLPPQWFISTQDCALLHIAAILYPEISSERLFGFAQPWEYNEILAIFRKECPDRKFPDDLPSPGPDLTKMPRDRAEEVLRWVKEGKGWDSLEESIQEMIPQFLQKNDVPQGFSF